MSRKRPLSPRHTFKPEAKDETDKSKTTEQKTITDDLIYKTDLKKG